MTHEEVQIRLPAFRLNDLSPAETVAVFEHIAECATCRVDLGRIGATLGVLQRAAAGLPAAEVERDVVAAITAPTLGSGADPTPRRLRLRIAQMAPAQLIAIAATVTIVALASTLVYSYLEARERSRRINCAGNLEQVGLALRTYISDAGATSASAGFDMWETEGPPAAGAPLTQPGDDDDDYGAATAGVLAWKRTAPDRHPARKGGAPPAPPATAEPPALGDLPALGVLFKSSDERKPTSDEDGFVINPGERDFVAPRAEGHTSLTTNGRVVRAYDDVFGAGDELAEAGGGDDVGGGDFGGGDFGGGLSDGGPVGGLGGGGHAQNLGAFEFSKGPGGYALEGTPVEAAEGRRGNRPLALGEDEGGKGLVDEVSVHDFANGSGKEWDGTVTGAAVVDTGVTRWNRDLASPGGNLPPGGDEDGDGLTNVAEQRFGTDPFLADTDDDGVTDVPEFEVRRKQKKVEYESLVRSKHDRTGEARKEHEAKQLVDQSNVSTQNRQFTPARQKYEEISVTDPFEAEAMEGLAAINKGLSDLSEEDPVEDDGELPSAPREPPPVNPFVLTAKDRFSTFALEADTAAYALTRRYIRKGYRPPAAVVRMEEFVNAFDYNYPSQAKRTFTVHAEAAPAPFGRGLTLLKIGVRGKVLGRDGRKPAHLVFAVDASGSMAREDRMPLVKHALSLLVDQLGEEDRVTLIAYGTRARLMLEAAPAEDRASIRRAVESVECGTSTNIQAGIELAYELAARHFRAGEVNRIILCSDGVANVGPSDAESLLAKVEKYRDQGITFTSVGVGAGSYDDRMLEQLANKGDGNYVFVDSRAEARRVFVDDMSATLQTIAKDVKIQVEFNPERVRRYRLIGYENRDVADKDFRNDAVDAGEIGSGQSATALYELELVGANVDRVPDPGTVYVRCRNLDSGEIEEISSRLTNALIARRTPEGDPRFFLAACVAEFAEILRGSEHARDGSLPGVEQAMIRVANALPLDERVQEFLKLIRQSQGLPQAK